MTNRKYIDNGLWLTMWRELKLELLKVKVSKHENLTQIVFNIKHRKELTLGVFWGNILGQTLSRKLLYNKYKQIQNTLAMAFG